MQWVLTAACLCFATVATAEESLLWLREARPTAQAREMTRALENADSYGLTPDAYRLGLSAAQLEIVGDGTADAELLDRYERELSKAASRFVSHLRHGRVAPRAAGFDLPSAKPEDDRPFLRQLAGAQDVTATLASFEPQIPPYKLLKQALARYRQLTLDRTLLPLPAPTARRLQAGDTYAGAIQLRRQLVAIGDLPETMSAGSHVLDTGLIEALARFQARHGLAADGTLGPKTLAALNVPMQHRVRQIQLSMERWRWLSVLARPDIVINIPQFMLYALPRPTRPGEALLEMPVIVGRQAHRTPVFSATIEEVVFNPYWDVPASILQKELLPKIRKDVSYLERHHFELVRGGGDEAKIQQPTPAIIAALATGELRLRQRPGADNALGPVKFIMPNRYSIRLHGTAEPKLFDSAQRAFSHGCIRVSDPAALAEYVLAESRGDWNAEQVVTALCGTEPRRIKLDTPVRVIVFYATAAATASRGVLFAPDLYGHDLRLEKLLTTAVGRPQTATWTPSSLSDLSAYLPARALRQ